MASKNDFPDLDRDNAVEDFSQPQMESPDLEYLSPELYEVDEWAF